ncbi:hypothetical protein Ancab_012452, partial [Ancistrocladus abbreviatus]
MGDKEEDEHITIPILGQESYYQSPSPPENPNTEIVVDKSSQRTPSGGSPSTDEPRPPSGDALPPEANKSKDEKWTAEGCFWLCVIIVLFLPCFLLYALTAMLWFDTNVLDDVEDDAKKQTYRRALEFKGRAFRVIKLVASILSLVMIGLLTWNTSETNLLFRMVKWTLISFLIFTLLWLLKNIVLLGWTAQVVYYRFSKRILQVGFQLYFIAQISGTYLDIFTPKKMTEIERSTGMEKQEDEKGRVAPTVAADQGKKKLERKGTIDQTKGNVNVDEARKRKEREDQESKRRAEDMIRALTDRTLSQATIYEIEKMARYFINLAKLSPRMDDDISDILSQCREQFPDVKYVNRENLQTFDLDEERAELFYGELQGESRSQQVSYEAFENWMTRAHKTCLGLGYTLNDVIDVVNCLNRIMFGFIITVVLLIWLLLTKIATTEVLVLIASQFVSAGFIFGESCKTLLEGIVFQFLRHPFNVGDRCLIADKDTEMEVKRMGVLTTTFLKIGSKDKVIYPNSLLISTPIVNLGEDPDPTDSQEYSVDKNTDNGQIVELDKKIR